MRRLEWLALAGLVATIALLVAMIVTRSEVVIGAFLIVGSTSCALAFWNLASLPDR
jgi:hypothetical protein